ncbi:MAG: ribonuclease III [Candidatus Comchoanobacterales bacterium]
MNATIGHYTFTNSKLYQLAITHSSSGKNHNERLEFLGDSILNATVADLLYQQQHLTEGAMSNIRSQWVNTKTLSLLGKHLHLEDIIITGESQPQITTKIIANTFEAIIGAIYLDSNWITVHSFIEECYQNIPNLTQVPQKHAKAELQEYCQKNKLPLPKYTILSTTGTAHNPIFVINCTVNHHNTQSPPVEAKQNGETLAAKKMLDQLYGKQS